MNHRICLFDRLTWLVLFFVFAGVAGAQGPPPPPFCSSITITPDPLVIPAEGGTFQHTVETEPNPFCACRWGSVYRASFGRAVGYPDDLTDFPVLRGERVESPAACVFDHTRVYEPNDGPRRSGIFGVWTTVEIPRPVDFSTATATIEIIQEEAGNSIRITSSIPEAKTLLKPETAQDFQATVNYNLESHEEARVMLKLLDAEGSVLASSEVVVVGQGTDEVELMIASLEIPQEGPVFLRAELQDDTSAVLKESEGVLYPVIRSHVEVTQVIQNTSNSVPLVADKRTVARVYVNAIGASPGRSANVELEGFRNGSSLGTLTDSAPVLEDEQFFLGAPTRAARWQLSNSANFVLPPDWIQAGGLELKTAGLEDPVAVEFQQRQVVRVGSLELCLVVLDDEEEEICPPDISAADTFVRKIFPVEDLFHYPLPVRFWGFTRFTFQQALLISAALIDEGLADIVVTWIPGSGSVKDNDSFARFKFARAPGGAANGVSLAQALASGVSKPQGCPSLASTIREVGLDPSGPNGLARRGFPTDHDFTLDCNLAANAWISPSNYRTLFEAFAIPEPEVTPSEKGETGAALIVSGTIQNGSARFAPLYRIEDANEISTLSQSGSYCLELVGTSEAVAACLDVEFDQEGVAPFGVLLPFDDGATEVRLVGDGVEIGAITASANMPHVSFDVPQPGETLDAAQPVTLQWTGTDADVDDLLYGLLYSSDGGESWLPITLDFPGTEFDLDASQIMGGGNVLFRVLASDGFHTAVDTVGPVTVLQNPAILVASPADLGRAVVGEVGQGVIMVENPGSGPLEIQSATLDNPTFSITGPVFPTMAPAGKPFPIRVSFAPTDAATHMGTLTIESNAVDQPNLQVTVEAEGVDPNQPFLDVAEEPITFSETGIGGALFAAVSIRNRGGSDLNLELTSTGDAFSVVDDVALTEKRQAPDPRTISGGADIVATVAFAPTSVGEFEGVLTIESNDPGRPTATIALSGIGFEAPPGPMINPGGVANAASFAADAIAPGAILSMFGTNFADQDALAPTTPLPVSLSGTSVAITDSSGMTRPAGLFGIFNGGQQINLYLDPATAVGAANLTLRRSDGLSSTVPIQVEQVGPGIFFIQNGAGQSVALANSLRISNGAATTELTFNTSDFSLAPIDLGPASDQVFVSLFLTGIQFATSVQNMSATVDGEPVPVFNFVGDLAQFVGLGQVNIGPIPRSFIGRGPVEITLTIDGAVANTVMVSFL